MKMLTTALIALLVTGGTTSVSAKEDSSQTYAQIKTCLEKQGLVEDEHFRKNPGEQVGRGMVQIRNGVYDDPKFSAKADDIRACATTTTES